MKVVWDYIEGLWKFQNGLIHGVNEEEEREILREQMEKEASDLYNNCTTVGKIKFLFKQTKQNILRKSLQNLETWIRNVKIAEKSGTQKKRKGQKKQNNDQILASCKTTTQKTTNRQATAVQHQCRKAHGNAPTANPQRHRLKQQWVQLYVMNNSN